MNCHKCDDSMVEKVTDLPFKLDEHRIVIVKGIPVLACPKCGEVIIDDQTMKTLDHIFESTNDKMELEIIRFAA
ncbi:MAG: YgiT-type zinc finger protein [Candidatus Wallbacteria bacterium]|nr:YgiT-type zinc finger protein [Candidatus Wallbacteria bacterium]